MKNDNTVGEAIIYCNYLNVSDISFHYSIGGSILMGPNPKDIDIIAVHATHDKTGKPEWIGNKLKEVGFAISGMNTGMHNKNFFATKREITLHIIVVD